MKILIPTALVPDASVPSGVVIAAYDPTRPIPVGDQDAEALVVWGTRHGVLRQAAEDLRNLSWVQSLGAGVDGVLAAGFAPSVSITSGRGLHDGPVTEHTLALLLAAARRLHRLRDAQKERLWQATSGGVLPLHERRSFRGLDGARVLVWGFGSIAESLAPVLRLLGADVRGVATRAGVRAGASIHTADELPVLLPDTDVLVCMLPSTPHTRAVVSRDVIEQLPPHAWLVNVGRGDAVVEDALVDALERGRLAGAALDVFSEEPLPPTSPLWALPDVILTPHVAGGRPIGWPELVRTNVERQLAGEPLENLVDRRRGY